MHPFSIKQSRQFHSLNAIGNPKPHKQFFENSLHGTQCDVKLLTNFFITATRQKQIGNLPFSWIYFQH